ncbi:uncharacterized conserved protein [Sanguibacter keddieii DSM 10542]|uniref:ATP-dependent Clp protease adapter protein ClpS n=1 Tax=Sanguibacter keddieii (strain ATCC 51767 / DSM 10542 / NCFB 3025 / ST-74) TaxID=446469 RepID=D1BK05_SANKS|nr:ATP-dependent Clp protease adapter ClpS [Sanguibacter keddieii]ACZ22414.1 uncharacterized conserved protein [Sanguibacter keddieii DSM 10542]
MNVKTIPGQEERQDTAASVGEPWVTLVWNDPVTTMNYVVYVFESYFGFSERHAHRLMMQVHSEGKAVVSTGGREKVEMDVQAMHSFGLWATMQRSGE